MIMNHERLPFRALHKVGIFLSDTQRFNVIKENRSTFPIPHLCPYIYPIIYP